MEQHSKDEILSRLKEKVRKAGSVEPPLVHQVEPSFRTPSQIAFNPALVAKIMSAKTDPGA